MTSITAKHQTTIPKDVRQYLGLKGGDKVTFSIENGRVYLQKVTGIDLLYLKSLEPVLTEWSSPEDDEAYSNL